jgi:hypothetical protein
MTDDEDALRRALAAVHALSPEHRAELLVIAKRLPTLTQAQSLKRLQHDTIRRFAFDWCAGMSLNSAAEKTDNEIALYEAGEWRGHQHLAEPPSDIGDRRLVLFKILKAGPAPRYEAIRKILRKGRVSK